MQLKLLDAMLASYSWHSSPLCFFHASSQGLFIAAFVFLLSGVFLCHPLIKHWVITAVFVSSAIAHRIVWMRQWFSYILSRLNSTFILFHKKKAFLSHGPISLFSCLLKSCTALPALERCFNSRSHVPTSFEYFLIPSDLRIKTDRFVGEPTGFPPLLSTWMTLLFIKCLPAKWCFCSINVRSL